VLRAVVAQAELNRLGWAVGYIGVTPTEAERVLCGQWKGLTTHGGDTEPKADIADGAGEDGAGGVADVGRAGAPPPDWSAQVSVAEARARLAAPLPAGVTPAFVTTLAAPPSGGFTYMWLATGAAALYKPSAAGFTAYLSGTPELFFAGQKVGRCC
jgi:hypothetical protein